MGYESRLTEVQRNALRRVVLERVSRPTQSWEVRGVQVDPHVLSFREAESGVEHVIVLAPGDHVTFELLEQPKIIPVGKTLEVVQ